MNEPFVGLEWFFASLLRTAWCAAILLLLVWIVQRAFGRWLTPRARHGLWLLVAARLCLIWAPPSAFSLSGILDNTAARAYSMVNAPQARTAPPEIAPRKRPSASPIEMIALPEPLPIVKEPPRSALSFSLPSFTAWTLLALIWAVGGIFFAWRLARDFWRLRRAVGKMTPITDAGPQTLLGGIASELGLRWHVELLASDELASPAVTGVFRPVLLMPRVLIEKLDPRELAHVFRHELTHVKRRDVLVNWLLAGLGAAYWFFPLMRYLLGQLRRTRELACDAAVLRGASQTERKAYGQTLVRVMEMVSQENRPLLTFTVGVAGMVWPMGNSRKESRMMRERLELVVERDSQTWRATLGAVAIALVLVAVGCTEKWSPPKNQGTSTLNVSFSATSTTTRQPSTQKIFPLSRLVELFQNQAPRQTKPVVSEVGRVFPSPEAANEWVPPPPEWETAEEAARRWLTSAVRDSGWNEGSDVSIAWDGDAARITQTEVGHERLKRAIAALEAAPKTQFALELRINSLSSADFVKLELAGLPPIRTNLETAVRQGDRSSISLSQGASERVIKRLPSQNYLLGDDQMRRIYKAFGEFPSYHALQAPKLTLLNGQVAELVSGLTRPFVTKSEPLNSESPGNEIEQPLIDVLFCGVKSETQAIALGDNRAWVRFQFRKSDLVEVGKEKQPGAQQEIQTPKLWEISQSVGLEISEGDTIAMFMKIEQPQEDKRDVLAVFLTLREVKAAKEATADAATSATPKHPVAENVVAVYEVTGLPSYRALAAHFKGDEALRKQLLASVFDQAEIVIRSTISALTEKKPEVDIQRNFSNMTLVITAPQEDHEKIADLFKQLERLPLAEAPIGRAINYPAHSLGLTDLKEVTRVYDVANLPFFRDFKTDLKNQEEPTKSKIAAAYERLEAVLKQSIPTLSEAESHEKLVPFYTNLTLVVEASQEEQEKIYDLLQQLERFPSEESLGLTKHIEAPRAFTTFNEAEKAANRQPALRESVAIVYDVSKTSPFRGFSKDSKNNEEPTKSQVTAAFNQIDGLIKSTIPAFVEKKPGATTQPFHTNLTLVVTAPLMDQEKVTDLIKQLERRAEKVEAPSESSESFTVVYDMGKLPLFAQFAPQIKSGQKPDVEELKAAFEKVETIICRLYPAFNQKDSGAEMQPFYVNRTLVVSAPPKLQKNVANVLKELESLSPKQVEYVVESSSSAAGKGTTVTYEVTKTAFFARFAGKLTKDLSGDLKEEAQKEFLKVYDILCNEVPALRVLGFGTECLLFVDNMTIVVAASPQVHQQVAQVLKSLEQSSLADAEKRAAEAAKVRETAEKAQAASESSKSTAAVYDVGKLPPFARFVSQLKSGQSPKMNEIKAEFEKLEAIIKRTLPVFAPKDSNAGMQPLYTNLTLVVNAPPEIQQKVADLLKELEHKPLESFSAAISSGKTETSSLQPLNGFGYRSKMEKYNYSTEDLPFIRELKAKYLEDQINPSQEQFDEACQKLMAIVTKSFPELTNGSRGRELWLNEHINCISVYAPEEDQKKVQNFLGKLAKASSAEAEKMAMEATKQE